MFENVVVGATDSEGAARAMRRAVEVARVSGGTLHLVTAYRRKRRRAPTASDESPHAEIGSNTAETLLAEFRLMADRESVRVEMHPVASDPVDAITRVAAEEGADLIVVGSRDADGVRHLSSVPKGVMDATGCAVLVV